MIKGSLRILTTNKSTFTRDNSTSFDLLQSYFLIVLPDSLTYKYYQKGRMVSLQFSSKIFLHLSASCLISLSLPLPPPARFHDLKCIHVFVAHTHRSHKKKNIKIFLWETTFNSNYATMMKMTKKKKIYSASISI